MKAYDIAGKRKGSRVNQLEFAQRMGWHISTLRDVEIGNIDITEEEYKRLLSTLEALSAEAATTERTCEKEEVLA